MFPGDECAAVMTPDMTPERARVRLRAHSRQDVRPGAHR